MPELTGAPERTEAASKRRLYSVLAVSNFAQGLAAFAVIGALASLIEEFDLPAHQAGLVVSLYAVVYAIASPLLVAWSGKRKRRAVLTTGLLVITIGAGLGLLATRFDALLVARVVMALGGGLVTPVAGAIAVATSTQQTRGRVLAAVFAGLTIAQAFGIPLGAWLVDMAGFRATFALIAVAAMIAAALVWRYVPGEITSAPTGLKVLASVFAEPRLMVALSFIVLFIGGTFVFLTYLTPFLQSRYALEGTALAGVLFVYGIGAVAGNALGGRMADRLGPVDTLYILCALQVLVLPALSLLQAPLAIGVSLLAFWSVSAWPVHAAQQARLVALDPARGSMLLSLHSSCIYLGVSAGSGLAGYLLEVSDDRWLGPVGAVLMLAAAVSIVVVERMSGGTRGAPMSRIS